MASRRIHQPTSRGYRSIVLETRTASISAYSFDVIGNKTAIVDQKGRSTTYRYDALKRPTGMVLPDGTPLDNSDNTQVSVNYNTLGWMTKLVKDGVTTEFEYEYDNLNRRTAVIRPLLQRSETSYDAIGRVKETRDFNGNVIKYGYDPQNQLISKQFVNEGNRIETYLPGVGSIGASWSYFTMGLGYAWLTPNETLYVGYTFGTNLLSGISIMLEPDSSLAANTPTT